MQLRQRSDRWHFSTWWSCCFSHKDASIRSSQLRHGRTVHLDHSSSTDTQLSSDIRVTSWSDKKPSCR